MSDAADRILAELGLDAPPKKANPTPKQMPTGQAPMTPEDNEARAQKLLEDLQLEQAPKGGFTETELSKNARQNAVGWKGAALPALGAAAGAVAGPALGTIAGAGRLGLWALGGEMAGGGLGEVANQALGITEPSKTAIALNTLSPVVGRAAAGVLQHAPRLLPNSVYAIRAGLVDRASEAPGNIIKAPDSKALYNSLPGPGEPGSFRITGMPETEQTIKHLRGELDNQTTPLAQTPYGTSISPMLNSIENTLYPTPTTRQVTGKFQLPPTEEGLAKLQKMESDLNLALATRESYLAQKGIVPPELDKKIRDLQQLTMKTTRADIQGYVGTDVTKKFYPEELGTTHKSTVMQAPDSSQNISTKSTIHTPPTAGRLEWSEASPHDL